MLKNQRLVSFNQPNLRGYCMITYSSLLYIGNFLQKKNGPSPEPWWQLNRTFSSHPVFDLHFGRFIRRSLTPFSTAEKQAKGNNVKNSFHTKIKNVEYLVLLDIIEIAQQKRFDDLGT